eukprot:SAG11_NODE_44755_length_151_cov_127.942308_1_plen_37_part_10
MNIQLGQFSEQTTQHISAMASAEGEPEAEEPVPTRIW